MFVLNEGSAHRLYLLAMFDLLMLLRIASSVIRRLRQRALENAYRMRIAHWCRAAQSAPASGTG